MNREQAYSLLPVSLQQVACTFEGWRVARMRFGGDFHALLNGYREREAWSQERIAEFSRARLTDFLQVISPERRRTDGTLCPPAENLGAWPVIGKAEAREMSDSALRSQRRGDSAIIAHTSGTTGAGLRFPVALQAHREQWAVWWRYRQWHGIAQGTPSAVFGGRPVVPPSRPRAPFWRWNRAGRQLLFSQYHLSPATARAYLEEIERQQLPWIHGYPSVVSLLASFALDLGIRLTSIRWVTLGAESLLSAQARVIQKAFGPRPIEHYGLAEGVANASSCAEGLLHIDEDFSFVELLPHESGATRIIGTGFTNPAFPLVRYDTGDLARVLPGRCSCGRPGRLLESIDGRREDIVITRTGARVGRLDHIFKDMQKVRSAQIRQDVPGEVTILVVPEPDFDERSQQQIDSEIRLRFGEDLAYSIDLVDSIQHVPGTKFRFVVSSLAEPRDFRA